MDNVNEWEKKEFIICDEGSGRKGRIKRKRRRRSRQRCQFSIKTHRLQTFCRRASTEASRRESKRESENVVVVEKKVLGGGDH